jgi:hypothetical protein
MDIQREDTAIVFIDPQNDVLSEKGPRILFAKVPENKLRNGAHLQGRGAWIRVFISPHYYFPVDKDGNSTDR